MNPSDRPDEPRLPALPGTAPAVAPAAPRRRTRWGLVLLLGVAVLGVLLVLGLTAVMSLAMPSQGVTLRIDGETLDIPALSAGQAMLVAGGLAVAALAVLTVVPLALLFGLALPLLLVAGLAVALIAGVAGVGMLVLSPLLLPLLALLWWSRRRARRPEAESGP